MGSAGGVAAVPRPARASALRSASRTAPRPAPGPPLVATSDRTPKGSVCGEPTGRRAIRSNASRTSEEERPSAAVLCSETTVSKFEKVPRLRTFCSQPAKRSRSSGTTSSMTMRYRGVSPGAVTSARPTKPRNSAVAWVGESVMRTSSRSPSVSSASTSANTRFSSIHLSVPK